MKPICIKFGENKNKLTLPLIPDHREFFNITPIIDLNDSSGCQDTKLTEFIPNEYKNLAEVRNNLQLIGKEEMKENCKAKVNDRIYIM